MITKPKGTRDIYGKEAKKWKYVQQVIDSIMEKYNYNYIRVPVFESSELFHRGVGETSDIVTKETYDFKDRGDRNLTLRPEGTAGVVRSYIENKMYGDSIQPVKLYYNCAMYRYERPQSGRYRELTQLGYEILGTDDPLSDAEVISLAVNIYIILGLKGIKVNINSLGDKESRDTYRDALIEYFAPKINDLCDDCKERLNKNPLRILDCKVDKELDILKNAPKTIDYLNDESKERFEKVKEYLEVMGVDYVVNTSIVRGLDYYNHTVFEIESDVEGFGAQNVIGAGGRYNGLVEQLDGPKTSCVGFAAGFDRLMLALEKENVKLPVDDSVDAFIMYVNEEEKKYATYLTQELRLNGFTVETEYNNRALKGQFKQADRLNTKYLIILNSEDLKNNEIKVKNNKTKDEEVISLDALIYYLDENIAEDICSCEEDCNEEHDCSCKDNCNDNDHECHCGNDCNCNEEHNCSCEDDCKSGEEK